VTFAFLPGFLAFLSLPVIVGLHLLRARQKRYITSSLRLWQFLTVQVHGTRPRRLPLTWLLLLDLLVAALLSLALAQPRLEETVQVGRGRQLVILLDTSTSMLAKDTAPDRFDQARQQISALVAGLGAQDQAALLTFGRSPRLVADLRQVSLAEFKVRLAGLQAGDRGHALAEALAAGKIAIDPLRAVEVHVFSDFQFPFSPPADFSYPVTWHALGGSTGNLAVLNLSATILTGNQIQVFARLANFSNQPAQASLSLLADGRRVSETSLNLPANGIIDQVWPVNGIPAAITVSLNSQDALAQDDSASIGVNPVSKARVLLVSDQPDLFRKVLAAVPGIDLQVIGTQDYVAQPFVDLTIFDGMVPSTLPDSSVLLAEPQKGGASGAPIFTPASNKQAVLPNALLAAAPDEPLLAGINFGGVRWSSAWTLPGSPVDFSTVLSAGGIPLLLRRSGAGREVLVLLADLRSGNFSQHPAFPVLVASLVDRVRQAPLPAQLALGDGLQMAMNNNYQSLRLIPPSGAALDFKTADFPTAGLSMTLPGLYRLELVDAVGQKSTFSLGVNAADPEESNLQPAPLQLADIRPASALPAAARTQVLYLEPWLIAAALVLLFLEAVLAWR
jgi:hypothetical protein